MSFIEQRRQRKTPRLVRKNDRLFQGIKTRTTLAEKRDRDERMKLLQMLNKLRNMFPFYGIPCDLSTLETPDLRYLYETCMIEYWSDDATDKTMAWSMS